MCKGCAKKTPNGLYMENKIVQTNSTERGERDKEEYKKSLKKLTLNINICSYLRRNSFFSVKCAVMPKTSWDKQVRCFSKAILKTSRRLGSEYQLQLGWTEKSQLNLFTLTTEQIAECPKKNRFPKYLEPILQCCSSVMIKGHFSEFRINPPLHERFNHEVRYG